MLAFMQACCFGDYVFGWDRFAIPGLCFIQELVANANSHYVCNAANAIVIFWTWGFFSY